MAEFEKDLAAIKDIEDYYKETQPDVLRSIAPKTIGKFCQDKELATGGANIRRRFTNIWKKCNLTQSRRSRVPWEDVEERVVNFVRRKHGQKKFTVTQNLPTQHSVPNKAYHLPRIRSYVVRERVIHLESPSQVSDGDLQTLRDGLPLANEIASGNDVVALSRSICQSMLDTWNVLPAHSRSLTPEPVTPSERIAMKFVHLVEAVRLGESSSGEEEKEEVSVEEFSEVNRLDALRRMVESTPINGILRVRLSVNDASEDEINNAEEDDATTPSPVCTCVKRTHDTWCAVLPMLESQAADENAGLLDLKSEELLDSTKCEIIIPTQRDHELRHGRSQQSSYRSHMKLEADMIDLAKTVARLQREDRVFDEYVKVQRDAATMTKDDFFQSGYIAAILDPFHTTVHVASPTLSMDVHVCIVVDKVAAVSAPVFDATCKELMGDREETSEATTRQRSYKKGEMVTMKRTSPGVGDLRNVAPRRQTGTGDATSSRQEGIKRAKFLHMTLRQWNIHKEKVKIKSRKNSGTPDNYWVLSSMNGEARKTIVKMFLGDSTGKLGLKKALMEDYITSKINLNKESVDAKQEELQDELLRLGGYDYEDVALRVETTPQAETRVDNVREARDNDTGTTGNFEFGNVMEDDSTVIESAPTAGSDCDLALETAASALSNMSLS